MRNIVQKYSNGTALIKNAVLNTDGNAPDPRISMGFGVGENGEIRHYNNPNDPMPIKTINMNGIKKWEETDDYIIYVDKDAVETLVENYQVGAYDLFLERKADVDGSMELLKENGIEWTSSDDSMLMLDVNEQLYRKSLLRDSVDMLPGDIEIQSTTRAVPTTYECCFRTDKKTGEIYVGEGYENFISGFSKAGKLDAIFDKQNCVVRVVSNNNETEFVFGNYKLDAISNHCYSVTCKNSNTLSDIRVYTAGGVEKFKVIASDDGVNASVSYVTNENTLTSGWALGFFVKKNVLPGDVFQAQITKTSTPKPFVKSVMPSGKLSFVTNATSETHSICVKGVGNPVSVIDGSLTDIKTLFRNGNKLISTGYPSRYDAKFNDIRTRDLWLNSGDVLFSNHYLGAMLNGNKVGTVKDVGSYGSGASEGEIMMSCNQYNKHTPTSFKQLLIYKGNLTEAELKAENEKEIKLERLYSLDDQVSLNFKCDENGLQYYNNPNDQMPIKTRNMAGLQKWEETEDYIIYVDKDAVMTTVQQYVTGTYDLFLERKNQIDGTTELLRENGIEWTAEDDSKLLQDINLVQLERVANTPTTMDEPTEIQTFEARTVPTTYECCFRTDKKSGEIYVGEGYENLTPLSNWFVSVEGAFDLEQKNSCRGFTAESLRDVNSYTHEIRNSGTVIPITKNTEYSIRFRSTAYGQQISDTRFRVAGSTTWSFIERQFFSQTDGTVERTFSFVSEDINENARFLFWSYAKTGVKFGVCYPFFVKKEHESKPFVKSVMPGGKLSFVTNATSETHSFLAKDNKNFFESEVASFSLIAQSNPSISIEQKEKVIWIGDDE